MDGADAASGRPEGEGGRRRGPLPPGIAIRAMRPGDLDALVAVDRAGTRLLARHGFPSLLEHMADAESMAALARGRAVWVAAGEDGEPVGFAVASDEGAFFYLHELTVDPAQGRRGIGTALLSAVIDHARWAFHTAVALDTFRAVPFNAPFYSKRGFIEIERGAVPEPLARLAEAGRPAGVHPASRVVMARRL